MMVTSRDRQRATGVLRVLTVLPDESEIEAVECIAAAMAEARREWVNYMVEVLKENLEHYTIDVFPEPPKGEHGKTIDSCSARALRWYIGRLIKDLAGD
jgi:hypothetical protein